MKNVETWNFDGKKFENSIEISLFLLIFLIEYEV
jgi:hypothetical protein